MERVDRHCYRDLQHSALGTVGSDLALPNSRGCQSHWRWQWKQDWCPWVCVMQLLVHSINGHWQKDGMEEGTSSLCPACGQSCPWGHQPGTAGKSGPWLFLSISLQSWVPSAWWLWQQSSRSQGGEARAYVGDTALFIIMQVHWQKNANDSFHFILWQTVLVAVTGCSLHLPVAVEVSLLTLCKRPTTLLIYTVYIYTYTHQPALKPPPGKMIIHCPLVDQMQRAKILSKQIRPAFYFRNSLRDLLF